MSDNDDEPRQGILERIKEEIQTEGIEPGSVRFEHRLDQLKVVNCRATRGVADCQSCEYNDYCELIKRVLRRNRGLE